MRIGKAAEVKVHERAKRDRKTGQPETVAKWASAHDLRRAFGFRWFRRIMPAELKELMRHADISTTMRFYVGAEAEQTADAVWRAYEEKTGNTFGNNRPRRVSEPSEAESQGVEG